jgi:hypothetical protein
VVTRILEAHPEAKVIVLGQDRDVELLTAERAHPHSEHPGEARHALTLEAATFAMQCRLELVPGGGGIKLGWLHRPPTHDEETSTW